MTWWESSRPWASGRWELQLRDDELADIAFDGVVVLRSIRAVIRDRDWNTASLVIDELTATDGTLELGLHSEGLGSTFRGTIRAEATASGLFVHLDVATDEEFWTNRTGLVVLHPPGLAGTPAQVQHSDGTRELSAFPEDISPHQPMFDITGLTWMRGGLGVDLRVAGDVFEMEDQRNWTDASFKTYSRPLALPFPYRLAAGERVQQRIEVQVRRGDASATPDDADRVDRIELVEGGSFPDVLLGASTAPDPAPAIDRLGAGVLVELDLAGPHWRAALDRAAASGLPLDVRFVTDDAAPQALDAAARALRDRDVLRVSAFPPAGASRHVSDAATIAALRAALARADVTASVVGGARSHFTELNRERGRLSADLDGIVFSITPLFHSLGTEQLVESLAMQRLVAHQAVGYAAGSPVHIGPVTLRPHFNDVATTDPPRPDRTDLARGYGPELIDADDPRQSAPELAAWTIASAAALAVPGVASLAYFEEWGPRGIRTSQGDDLPVAAAVRTLAGLSGSRLLHGRSLDGLIWAIGGDDIVLVANLDDRPRTIAVQTPSGVWHSDVPAGGWRALGEAAGHHGGHVAELVKTNRPKR